MSKKSVGLTILEARVQDQVSPWFGDCAKVQSRDGSRSLQKCVAEPTAHTWTIEQKKRVRSAIILKGCNCLKALSGGISDSQSHYPSGAAEVPRCGSLGRVPRVQPSHSEDVNTRKRSHGPPILQITRNAQNSSIRGYEGVISLCSVCLYPLLPSLLLSPLFVPPSLTPFPPSSGWY